MARLRDLGPRDLRDWVWAVLYTVLGAVIASVVITTSDSVGEPPTRTVAFKGSQPELLHEPDFVESETLKYLPTGTPVLVLDMRSTPHPQGHEVDYLLVEVIDGPYVGLKGWLLTKFVDNPNRPAN